MFTSERMALMVKPFLPTTRRTSSGARWILYETAPDEVVPTAMLACFGCSIRLAMTYIKNSRRASGASMTSILADIAKRQARCCLHGEATGWKKESGRPDQAVAATFL